MIDRQRLLVATILLVAGGGLLFVVTTHETAATPTIAFEPVTDAVGIDYRTTGNDLGNGDGAVLITDYDRDGWQDLLLLGGDRPALYRNVHGDTFKRTNALPDIPATDLKSGLFFDYDNDGWQDLLLLPRTGAPVFLENNEGTFVHASVGLAANLTWGTSAVAADYNGDGCLDVFITQNGDWSARVPNRSSDDPIRPDNGEPNLLFAGNCSAFSRVQDAGLSATRWSLAASFVDLTGDGRPDIHVANDFNYDYLYVNQGNGTFEPHRLAGTNRHGMTSEIADVNGDTRMDIFVTNIEFQNPDDIWSMRNGFDVVNRGNNLLINTGNASFVDRATEYGVRQGGWGWAGNLVDLDNDGDLDLVHATQDYLHLTNSGWRAVSNPPALWRRTETGFTQLNASKRGMTPGNGRGLAVFDYDRDGDQDVVVANTDGRFELLENVGATGHWLQVQVRAADGVVHGTRVSVRTQTWSRVSVRDSEVNFFSQSTRILHFGLGTATEVDLTVTFPDGTVRTFEDIGVDRRVIVFKNGTVRTADR